MSAVSNDPLIKKATVANVAAGAIIGVGLGWAVWFNEVDAMLLMIGAGIGYLFKTVSR